MNYFEGVPMKVIVDYIAMNLIDGLNLDIHFVSSFDAHLFRSKVDAAVWKASEQTKDGIWNSENVK